MALPKYSPMDIEDFFYLDQNSKNARYEYFNGAVRMLAGGSPYHAVIIANLTGILYGLLGDGPCYAYSPDAYFQIAESVYVHPDVTVSCDQRDLDSEDVIRYPRLVVEVLSPGTEASDRGEKSIYYQRHPTIQEYVIADSLSVRIEVYRRAKDKWILSVYGPDSTIQLESLGIQFPIAAAYRGTKLSGIRKNSRRKKNNNF